MISYLSIFLVALTVASGLIWLVDSLAFSSNRKQKVVKAIENNEIKVTSAFDKLSELPLLVAKSQQTFPITLVLLILSTIVFNPFKISLGVYFSLFLVLLTIGSGLVWLFDHFISMPKRNAMLSHLEARVSLDDKTKLKIVEQPFVADTAQQIFPVIAFVMILRSFLYEPFQIPSGSMMPTLLVGDFILVEKFSYGLKDPVWRNKFMDVGEPERGDVAVFKFPKNPTQDYIKRVVGLPGDTVIYRDKQIQIKPACDTADSCPAMKKVALKFESRGEAYQQFAPLEKYTEQLGDVSHEIYRTASRANFSSRYYQQPGTQIDEWIVPEGHYFVLGDNRDNSEDGRYWGFVPEENLVGKAVAIWISFEFDRVPSSWVPSWIPTGVRFSRVGSIE